MREAVVALIGTLTALVYSILLTESGALEYGNEHWAFVAGAIAGALTTFVLYPDKPDAREEAYAVALGVGLASYWFALIGTMLWLFQYVPD